MPRYSLSDWTRRDTARSGQGKSAGRRRRAGLGCEALEPRQLLAGAYSGIVFQDFNANGARDLGAPLPNSSGVGTISAAVDRGLAGVAVTAYNPAGNVAGTATTAADGTYTLNATGAGPYRIEFTSLPTGFFSGPRGPNSDTTVQFVADGGATNISLGLVRPDDYAPDNPPLATTLQYHGPANGQFANSPALITFPYSSGSAFNDPNLDNYGDPTTHAITVPFSQIGATWGLGYDGASRTIYAAALMKKHSGFGPGGPGAIYAVDRDTGAVTLFATLNAGADPHNPNDYVTDNFNTTWDAVGKRGLGGLDVGPDGTVYVMNLFDRSLYALRPDGSVAGGFPVPLNAPGATGTNGADLRPFAVEYHQGRVYVGMVNSAESTQNTNDLHAYVYAFDPTTGTYSPAPVFQTDLDYPRTDLHQAIPGSAPWNPWSPTFADKTDGPSLVYPQPELTGLAFDPDGNMVLGFRDRISDQAGGNVPSNPNNPTQEYAPFAGGDVLRAFINTPGNLSSGWTLENNGRGPAGQGSSPQNTGEGPGGGEFYYDNFTQPHAETALGAVLQVPGHPDLAGTFFDPVNINDSTQYGSGGLRWLANATGQGVKTYRLYSRGDFAADNTTVTGNGSTNGTFGKGGGIGDLIALYDPAPIEIGNRLWLDADRDGIQDAGELPLAGVTVELRDVDGNVIATAVTDANGNYTFSSDPNRTSTGAAIYGLDLAASTDYTLVVPPGQAALADLIRTFANADASDGGDTRDSDGQPNGSNGWTLPVTTAGPGASDHTADFGFTTPLSLGDQVWEDRNNNGVVDPGEPGLPGVPVRLYQDNDGDGVPDGPPVATTMTGPDGSYVFPDLLPGSYIVETDLPPGYASSTGVNGSATGPYEGAPDPDNDVNNDDNGTTVGTVVRSGTVTLDGSEPTDDGDDDPNTNLTVDFGLFQPLSLGDQVWEDRNNNGVLDPGEPSLPGVPVQLLDSAGNVIATTTTDANGNYRFDNLIPGDYRVRLTPPPGYRSSTGTNGSGTGPSEGAPDPDDDLDNGDNGTTVGSFIESGVITLDVGAEPTNDGDADPNSNLTVDFGLFQPASVGDRVFIDADGDGTQDPGEPGVPGVVVRIYDEAGNVVATTTTDANGNYLFDNLIPGTYSVGFDPSTLPPDFALTRPGPSGTADPADSDADPTTGRTEPFTLVPGQNDPTRDAGLVPLSSVSGQTFVDMNNNGVRDPGEPPIPGTTVILTGVDDLGNPVELTAITGPDGSYRFDDLRPGTYTVTEVQPNGFLDGRDRTGSVGGLTGDDVTRQIVVGPGVAATAYDFGELPTSTCLEGTVYYDLNHNGQRDDEFDFGIAGVTVTLTGVDDRGQPVMLTTTTDAEGKYRFEGLRPGTYTLTETQPRHFHDYHDAVGSLGGLVSNDRISQIVVQPGQCGMGYDFGELQPHGPQGRLRNVTVHTGNFVDLLNRRRALNPARFDAHHPAIGPVIAQGRVPWGIGMFPPSPKVYRQVPTVGTRPVPLGRAALPRGPLASRKSALARFSPRLGAARAMVLNRGTGVHAGPHGRGH